MFGGHAFAGINSTFGGVGNIPVSPTIAVTGLEIVGHLGDAVCQHVHHVDMQEELSLANIATILPVLTHNASQSTMTGNLGSVTISAGVKVSPAGLLMTAAAPSATVALFALPSGLPITGNVGTPALVTNNILTATGNEITGNLGSAVAEVFYIVTPTGVEMTGNVGTVGISADQTAPTTGIPINAPDPSVSIELVATPAGLPITGAIGDVGGAIAVLTTGLPMTAHTDPSFIFTWTDVDDTTTGGSTWTDVDDSNSSTWTPVTPSDSSTWTPVDSTTTGGNTWTPVDSSTN